MARVIRVVVLVALSLQLTGVLHVAVDTLALSTEEALGHVTDTGDDGNGDCPPDCPPGCPTCHHANGGVAAPPPPPVEQIRPAFALADHERAYPSLRSPPPPALDSVFRPPRRAAFVTAG